MTAGVVKGLSAAQLTIDLDLLHLVMMGRSQRSDGPRL
jgi:hypothetical protein